MSYSQKLPVIFTVLLFGCGRVDDADLLPADAAMDSPARFDAAGRAGDSMFDAKLAETTAAQDGSSAGDANTPEVVVNDGAPNRGVVNDGATDRGVLNDGALDRFEPPALLDGSRADAAFDGHDGMARPDGVDSSWQGAPADAAIDRAPPSDASTIDTHADADDDPDPTDPSHLVACPSVAADCQSCLAHHCMTGYQQCSYSLACSEYMVQYVNCGNDGHKLPGDLILCLAAQCSLPCFARLVHP